MIGGLLGGIVGAGISATAASIRASKARKALQKAINALGPEYDSVKKDIQKWYDSHQYATKEDLDNYLNNIRNTSYMDMYSDFYDKNNDGIIDDEDIEEFNYDKSKEDFYNKNAEKILGNTMNVTQGAAASKGMGRSYDGLAKMTQDVIDKDEELWNEAQDEYIEDYNQKYKTWSDYLTQKSNQYNDYLNAYNSDLSLQKDLADMYSTGEANEFQDLLNVNLDKLNSMTQLNAAKASQV